MALNKSTSHKFQLNHLICWLVGSLLIASSIEANELSSALSALHTEISGLNFDVHPSNMNNETIRANFAKLNNAIVNVKNLTNTTSNIGKRVAAATPNKTLIGLDVTNISNALNGIERELTKYQNLFNDYTKVITDFGKVKTKFSTLQQKVDALA
ncbi:hypothetical protein DdX_18212 [Ditylenchus destructor]|uniref:Uncharacterized protein n=1 Tax=Ditylenchus destructor TaxID=166010 RepID=A0AAD4QV36_9BILA|nr:hypothetical protein DdX_18212 [Ditylenchus destructor]